jgi:hypothetical protein
MIGLDPLDPTQILDLKDLGDLVLSDEMRQYMISNHADLGLHSKTAILVTLYQDDMMMPEELLTISPDLVVTSKAPLDQRKQYHLVVSVVTDPSILSASTITHLLENGELGKWYLTMLLPLEADQSLIPNCIESQDGPRLPKKAWWDTVAKIPTAQKHYSSPVGVSRLSVASYTINAISGE